MSTKARIRCELVIRTMRSDSWAIWLKWIRLKSVPNEIGVCKDDPLYFRPIVAPALFLNRGVLHGS